MVESSIVGRQRETDRLREAIRNANEGHGSLWFLTGEAGIGKSRLAEEASNLARELGMRTLWGRCWEAGGAPAYWPWVQILRAMMRTAEPGQFDAFLSPLAQVLPELREAHGRPDATDLGPEQARFQLMDGVGHVLASAAARCPLLVILEDLHVADVSTVLLLDFLAATVRNLPVAIVGTYRDAELAEAPSGAQLVRTAREGQRIALERLSKSDIADFLEATDEPADSALVDSLHRITEGHPLFLVEVGRIWQTRGSRDRTGRLVIPNSVRQAIHDRLDALSDRCTRALRRGAIVGREFETSLLNASHPEDANQSIEACQEATDRAILVEVAPQRYRFSHYLVREVVYDAIAPTDREEEHRRLACALLERSSGRNAPNWAEVAHHFSAAGARSAMEAADAHLQASAQALDQLAFDEAVGSAERALAAAERIDPVDASLRCRILIKLGHAQTRAGDIGGGKSSCVRAAGVARELGDAHLFAEAALEHGTALIFANVDPELVALLREALERLDEVDSTLRARVMARLAAALQPASDPRVPMDLARDAIAMARRTGDRAALLDTLRSGGSALVDLGDLEERLALDREHAALAEELSSPTEALRGNVRSFMDFVQLGRLDDAYRTLHACERATEALGHPAYRWCCVALQGMRSLWEGDFELATKRIEELGTLASQSGDPNARRAREHQEVRLHQQRGDFEAHARWLAAAAGSWRGTPFGDAAADVFVGAENLMAGRTTTALENFPPEGVQMLVQSGDASLGLWTARLCVAANDQELAERLRKKLLLAQEVLVTTGMLGVTIEGPTSWGLALLSRCLGLHEEAKRHYEHAMTTTRRLAGRPALVMIGHEFAQMLATTGEPQDQGRAAEVAQSTIALAEELGMIHVVEPLRALSGTESGKPTTRAQSTIAAPDVRLRRVGDAWMIAYDGHEFHLKDIKGVRLLAELIENPGREFHVLDLGENRKAAEKPIDRGDSGAILDEEARRQYQARVLALRQELEEAEDWNDTGRAQKLQEELDFLTRQLAQAFGLGGRERRTGGAAERARINVQRRIRDAIRRIEAHHAQLAKHLGQAVKTGTYCSYDP